MCLFSSGQILVLLVSLEKNRRIITKNFLQMLKVFKAIYEVILESEVENPNVCFMVDLKL